MEMLLKEMSITVVLLVTLVGTDVSEEFLQSAYSLWQLQLVGHGDTPASCVRTVRTMALIAMIINNSDVILLTWPRLRTRNKLHVK
jgi:hypothetical protein